jgi:hypothetical protein
LRNIEIAAYFVYALLVFIANFSGIAGGYGLIVYLFMFGFTTQVSIILANS